MTWLVLMLPALLASDPLIPDDMVYETEEEEAAAMAQVFVETMIGGQAGLLANMCTDPFTLDGRIVTGRDAIRKLWAEILKARAPGLRKHGEPKLATIDFAEAVKRFGKPPAKFSHLNLKKCFFVVVTFKTRPGLMLILAKGKKKGEGWLVTAVTD